MNTQDTENILVRISIAVSFEGNEMEYEITERILTTADNTICLTQEEYDKLFEIMKKACEPKVKGAANIIPESALSRITLNNLAFGVKIMKEGCQHEPDGLVCAVQHYGKGQCNHCKKCGQYY